MADQIKNPEIKIRFPDHIQEAHDVLVAIITGEVDVYLDASDRLMFHSALDALCWVLSHDHNTAFAANLELLKGKLAEKGYRLIDTRQYCPNGTPNGANGGQDLGESET